MPPQSSSEEPEKGPDLETARSHLLDAEARLKELKQSLSSEKPSKPPEEDISHWRALYRSLYRLRQLMEGWSAAAEEAELHGDAQWARRRREIEARSLRVESALRELEKKQDSLDLERQRVLSELERVQQGWQLLREEAGGPQELPESSLSALLGRVQALTASWDKLLAKQAESYREWMQIEQVWRWLLTVSLPSLEAKATSGPGAQGLLSLRRGLEDLDRRWKAMKTQLLSLSKAEALPEIRELQDALAESRKHSQELATALQGVSERLQAEQAMRQLEASELLRQKNDLIAALERARKESETWQGLSEASRGDLDKLLNQYFEYERRIEELGLTLETERKARLEAMELASRRQAELERERDDAKAQSVERPDLKAEIERREKELAVLAARIKEATDKSAEAARLLELSQEERFKAVEAFRFMSSRLAEATGQVLDLTRRLEISEQERSQEREEADKRSEALREIIRKSEPDITELRNHLEDERRQAASELSQTRDRIVALERQLREREDRLAEAKALAQERQALEGELDRTRRELDLARRESERLKSASEQQIASYQKEIEGLSEAGTAAQGPAAEPVAGLPAIPSMEPVLEPAWARVLERLREPIEAAYGQLRRLSTIPLAEGQRALVRLAAGSLAQAADLIRAIGEYLDDTAPPPAPGKVIPVLEAALASWETAFRSRQTSLIRLFDRDLPTVVIQAEPLRIAIYHIVRNAYEALPQSGGLLTVKAWKDGSGQIFISFTDSGPGFSNQALGQLFTPFYSTKPRHLGLGLALARRILRRVGGEVEASNQGKQGAVVTFKLPLASGPIPPLIVEKR
ncbi:MAG: hypothetical protein HY549_00970 [Elusimicrobia bacterium]|nr:hypothetical protein [Elusimicrobiota bacterium]